MRREDLVEVIANKYVELYESFLLREDGFYMREQDVTDIQSYNKNTKNNTQWLLPRVIPEQFMGSLLNAKVLIMNLNMGGSLADAEFDWYYNNLSETASNTKRDDKYKLDSPGYCWKELTFSKAYQRMHLPENKEMLSMAQRIIDGDVSSDEIVEMMQKMTDIEKLFVAQQKEGKLTNDVEKERIFYELIVFPLLNLKYAFDVTKPAFPVGMLTDETYIKNFHLNRSGINEGEWLKHLPLGESDNKIAFESNAWLSGKVDSPKEIMVMQALPYRSIRRPEPLYRKPRHDYQKKLGEYFDFNLEVLLAIQAYNDEQPLDSKIKVVMTRIGWTRRPSLAEEWRELFASDGTEDWLFSTRSDRSLSISNSTVITMKEKVARQAKKHKGKKSIMK